MKTLKSPLQDACQWKDDYQDMLEDVEKTCNLCKSYMKIPSRPVVGLSMAFQFSERVRRASPTKVRAAEQIFENGDTVFLQTRRQRKEWWLGPVGLVFQDGKVVFIRHSGILVRVSPNRLTKTHDTNSQNKAEKHERDSSDRQGDVDTRKVSEKAATMFFRNGARSY